MNGTVTVKSLINVAESTSKFTVNINVEYFSIKEIVIKDTGRMKSARMNGTMTAKSLINVADSTSEFTIDININAEYFSIKDSDKIFK
jgi:hypothetical protein